MVVLLLISSMNLSAKSSVHVLDDDMHVHDPKHKDAKFLGDYPIDPETGKPKYDDFIMSKNGNFKIHFFNEGNDAVEAVDENNNNVPDFIDSLDHYFEYVYDLYVNKLEYRDPIHPHNEYYEVYVIDLGNFIDSIPGVGGSFTGGLYGKTNTGKKLNNGSKSDAYTSWIEIDNDFSPDDKVKSNDGTLRRAYYRTGYEGLKVTVAHEFHHAVQFIYGYGNHFPVLAEMTSVLMEDHVFPDINDYYQYLPGFFRYSHKYPLSSNSAATGYRYSLFFMMLEKKYDVSLIRKAWDSFFDGKEFFGNLDRNIKELSNGESSIGSEMAEFLEWLYFTGERSHLRDPSERFSDAADFPELFVDHTEEYSSPSYISGGAVNPYEIRQARILFRNNDFTSDDTLDVVLTDTSRGWFKNPYTDLEDYSIVLSDQDQGGMNKLNFTTPKYFEVAAGEDVVYFLKSASGDETIVMENAFPNPYNLAEKVILNFPVPSKTPVYSKISVSVYSADMNEIHNDILQVVSVNNKRVVRWENTGNKLSSGVYFYSTEFGGEKVFGKFAVIRE